jgi:3'-phosphoadenosine 5'-phosphosulfate (PAPS) 3'-phosphatase
MNCIHGRIPCQWDTAAARGVIKGAAGVIKEPDEAIFRCGKREILKPHFIVKNGD